MTKIYISSILGMAVQSQGSSIVSKVTKKATKVPFLGADLRVDSCFGPLREQNRSKPKIVFPQNLDLAGLMVGTKKFQVWPFRINL